MMKSTLYTLLIFMAGGLLGIVFGGYGGSYLAASAVINNWINSQTKDGNAQIAILINMRGGNNEQALELVEAELDKDIVSLLPEYYEKFNITDQLVTAINTTLKNAKDYRMQFPRESKGRLIDTDVNRALSLVN